MDKLQITFNDIAEPIYTFTNEDSKIISKFLTDCYLGETLPSSLGKIQVKFYLYCMNLLMDKKMTLPYTQVKKLVDFLNGSIIPENLYDISIKLYDWLNKK